MTESPQDRPRVITCTPDVEDTRRFYNRLQFDEFIDPAGGNVCFTDGRVIIEVAPERTARITLVVPVNLETFTDLRPRSADGDDDALLLCDPNGVRVRPLVHAPDSEAGDGTPSMLGTGFHGFSIEAVDPAATIEFWKTLGLEPISGDLNQGYVTMSAEGAPTVTILKAGSCPHLFFNPGLNYFNSGRNPEVIAAVRNAGNPDHRGDHGLQLGGRSRQHHHPRSRWTRILRVQRLRSFPTMALRESGFGRTRSSLLAIGLTFSVLQTVGCFAPYVAIPGRTAIDQQVTSEAIRFAVDDMQLGGLPREGVYRVQVAGLVDIDREWIAACVRDRLLRESHAVSRGESASQYTFEVTVAHAASDLEQTLIGIPLFIPGAPLSFGDLSLYKSSTVTGRARLGAHIYDAHDRLIHDVPEVQRSRFFRSETYLTLIGSFYDTDVPDFVEPGDESPEDKPEDGDTSQP